MKEFEYIPITGNDKDTQKAFEEEFDYLLEDLEENYAQYYGSASLNVRAMIVEKENDAFDLEGIIFHTENDMTLYRFREEEIESLHATYMPKEDQLVMVGAETVYLVDYKTGKVATMDIDGQVVETLEWHRESGDTVEYNVLLKNEEGSYIQKYKYFYDQRKYGDGFKGRSFIFEQRTRVPEDAMFYPNGHDPIRFVRLETEFEQYEFLAALWATTKNYKAFKERYKEFEEYRDTYTVYTRVFGVNNRNEYKIRFPFLECFEEKELKEYFPTHEVPYDLIELHNGTLESISEFEEIVHDFRNKRKKEYTKKLVLTK